jgi:hypothetical protein
VQLEFLPSPYSLVQAIPEEGHPDSQCESDDQPEVPVLDVARRRTWERGGLHHISYPDVVWGNEAAELLDQGGSFRQ